MVEGNKTSRDYSLQAGGENLAQDEVIPGVYHQLVLVTPRSGGYGDATVTYIRRSEISSRTYAKHQYK